MRLPKTVIKWDLSVFTNLIMFTNLLTSSSGGPNVITNGTIFVF